MTKRQVKKLIGRYLNYNDAGLRYNTFRQAEQIDNRIFHRYGWFSKWLARQH